VGGRKRGRESERRGEERRRREERGGGERIDEIAEFRA